MLVQPTWGGLYLPPPIECPGCGGNAIIVRRSPVPRDTTRELRIYVCEECDRRTEVHTA